MKLKRIGAAVAGAALLGATMAGAVSAQQLDVPERDFFIDETTGLNSCIVVVGAGAAAADVVSASYIAAEIGTMAYTEETNENWIRPGVLYNPVPDTSTPAVADGVFEEQVDNYYDLDAYSPALSPTYNYPGEGGYNDLLFDDFRDAIDMDVSLSSSSGSLGPESYAVLPYLCTIFEADDAIRDLVTFKNNYPDVSDEWGYVDLGNMVTFPDNPYGSEVYIPHMPWWDYDVYVDAMTVMSEDLDYSSTTTLNGNFLVDTGCSYETITADFSLRDLECSAEFCTACLAACDQNGLFYDDVIEPGYELTDLLECQTYPNVYPRHYWGTPEVYAAAQEERGDDGDVLNYCDPVGGVQYRTIVDGVGYRYSESGSPIWSYSSMVDEINWCAVVVPSNDNDRKETGDALSSLTCPTSEAYLVCNEHHPLCVTLYCDPCDVFFLGEHYDALHFGTDVQGYDFMLYGTPEWYVEEKLAVGESKEYNGWEITINDLGIYENKVYSTITNPDGVSYDYLTVIDQYTSQSPSPGDGDRDQCYMVQETVTLQSQQNDYLSPYCECGGTAGDNEENDTIAFVQRVFEADELCGEGSYGVIDYGWFPEYTDCGAALSYVPFGEVVFAVKFVKTMIGAAGTYVVEYHAYDLADYGVLKEQIYNGPCETPVDPAISVNGLDWYFDIIPGNGILVDLWTGEILDLDNDPALYAEGNPNFDIADLLTIYNNRIPVPADPTQAEVKYLMNFYNAYYDSCTYEWVLETYTPEVGGPSYLVPKCSPMLELWLATPVELAGLCEDELIVELADCDGNNYFTLKVEDEDHTDYCIDGSITVSRDVLDSTDVVRTYVDIDSTMLVKLDGDIDTALKESYNLILVGGPVANTIVSELVDLGETTMEMWETSEGDVVLIEDVYSIGHDVLIVAGADRDKTESAAVDLIDSL